MVRYVFPLMLTIICTLSGCQTGNDTDKETGITDTLAIMKGFAHSPALTPAESLKKMQLQQGFTVKLVASEPLINTPVALNFDEKGRMWVIEMQGYMPDTVGTGEDIPNGKIVILEDTNGDGMTDKRTVFLDSLVLPRAICLIENGILVAEPPNLWFVEIINGKAGKKTLVDKEYAVGGNVEHQPNGLIRDLDNWIYNAKSAKRYRKNGRDWLIEQTHFRGQYGITMDNYGRLLYNHNSANVLGDFFPPGMGSYNRDQREVKGYGVAIVPDNRVYPARPNTGVNRGYQEATLNADLKLANFTAACGPVYYREDLFGDEYQHNVFVAEPSANLVKRNILTDSGYRVTGKQAYTEKEFLASTDERFRPVNLYSGPDGALYIVDMYRGIIQHKTYLTDYLKHEIVKRELSQPLSYGRIYKIFPSGKETTMVNIPEDPFELVKLLGHPNGWVRDKAQQLLVDNKYVQTNTALREMLQSGNPQLGVIHALWTMEGLDLLKPTDLLPLLQTRDWPIRMQALSVLSSVMDKDNYKQYLPELKRMLQQNDSLAAPLIGFLAHYIQHFDKNEADNLLTTLMKQYPDDPYVASAIISNLENREEQFLKKLMAFNPDSALALNKQLKKIIQNINASKHAANAKKLAKKYPEGVALFKSTCQTCHGEDGNGLRSIAPPLNGSEWVTGDKSKLASIALFGLTGPVKVNGKLYKAPEISGEMPGIWNNKNISDKTLAQVLSFVRNSWNNKASEVTEKEVSEVRKKYDGRESPFTMEELNR